MMPGKGLEALQNSQRHNNTLRYVLSSQWSDKEMNTQKGKEFTCVS